MEQMLDLELAAHASISEIRDGFPSINETSFGADYQFLTKLGSRNSNRKAVSSFIKLSETNRPASS